MKPETLGSIALFAMGIWALRGAAHRAILSGLRAPRVPHECLPAHDTCARSAWLTGVGGKRLFAWHLPAQEPTPAAAPAVVLMHGWGANAAMMLPVARPLQAAGWHVVLVDARCHGRSDDESFTSMPRFADDLDTALDWIRAQPGVDPRRLAVIGHSVGAGAALLCASRRRDLAAVVSVSAFAHPREVMHRWLALRRVPFVPLGWYVLRHVQKVIGARFDDFAPVSTIGRVQCPVMLIHGNQDEIVPLEDVGRLLAAGRPGAVEALEVCGGHDLSLAIEAHAPLLIDFLERCWRTEPVSVHAMNSQPDSSISGAPDRIPIRGVTADRLLAPAYPRGGLTCKV